MKSEVKDISSQVFCFIFDLRTIFLSQTMNQDLKSKFIIQIPLIKLLPLSLSKYYQIANSKNQIILLTCNSSKPKSSLKSSTDLSKHATNISNKRCIVLLQCICHPSTRLFRSNHYPPLVRVGGVVIWKFGPKYFSWSLLPLMGYWFEKKSYYQIRIKNKVGKKLH